MTPHFTLTRRIRRVFTPAQPAAPTRPAPAARALRPEGTLHLTSSLPLATPA